MKRRTACAGAAILALAALAGCGRRPKARAPAAASDALTDATASSPIEAGAAVNGEAALAPASSLKEASSTPQDPIAKVGAARLAQAVVDPGALNGPERLASVCVEARVACGFELLGDAWDRPEARAVLSSVTAAQALDEFMGKEYRLAWIGPVAHVFPAAAGEPLPLDAPLSADVSMNSLSREPAETIHDLAVKLGLRMPAPRPRPLRTDLVGASTMPIKNSARYILDYLTRPAVLRPASYVAVYGPGRDGSLSWYWGEPPPW